MDFGSLSDSRGDSCIASLFSHSRIAQLMKLFYGQLHICSPKTHSSLHLLPTSQVHTLAIFEYVPTAIFADSNGLSFQLIDVIPCSDSWPPVE